MWYDGQRYVSASERRDNARRQMAARRQGGKPVTPIEPIRGRGIARTFWGQAWCRHIECLSDFASRLDRGKTYVRNGSVCHLEIKPGKVEAIVAGQTTYDVSVHIDPLEPERWAAIKERCAGRIGSLVELLQGRFSDDVMAVLTDAAAGMFPRADDFRLDCSCPDFARLCKHLAATLYGVGVRLDERPDLLFTLRGVDAGELLAAAAGAKVADVDPAAQALDAGELSAIFGVEIALDTPQEAKPKQRPRKKKR
jgi:uncharacterized Zn finger protein